MADRAAQAILSSGHLHLWYARPDAIEDRLLAAYQALLTDDERARWRRFHFERHRREFLVTRALCRTVLSRYAPVDPSAWRFRIGADGKPELESRPGVPRLRFNLSNTEGMVVCAIVLEHDVGVDVEDTTVGAVTLEVARDHFAPAEIAALTQVPTTGQRARFFEYWTLKEAYIKARGEGVRLGLDRFAFEIGSPPRITFAPGFDDEPSCWTFCSWMLSARHQAALAVRTSAPVELTVRELVPLAGDEP